jgi:hypothetical protein
MDFAALQQKLFDLDPSDRAEDLRRLTESVGSSPQLSAEDNEAAAIAAAGDLAAAEEVHQVPQGAMPVEGDYSLSDFAALAGVTLNESQKTGSAGQLKGKDPMPKAKARGKHPHVDKLVGEDTVEERWQDDAKRGWKDSNNLGAIGLGADDIAKKFGFSPSSSEKSTTTKEPVVKKPVVRTGDYKDFLKQHTVGLKAIVADPKKKAEFDKFMAKMAEDVQEAPKPKMPKTRNPVASHAQSSGSGVHADQNKKKQPMRKDKHKKQLNFEGTESIKEMLYRKLNAKK